MLNRRGPISKLVGGAIGLTKEYQADRNERKAAQAAQLGATPTGSSSTATTGDGLPVTSEQHDHGREDDGDFSDDEQWALDLDEAQQGQTASPEQGENIDIDQLLRDFAARHPAPAYTQASGLPMPVILPQRRPESRHRGFVRAYAPALQNCGIDQATWLDFLDGFEKSINANPW